MAAWQSRRTIFLVRLILAYHIFLASVSLYVFAIWTLMTGFQWGKPHEVQNSSCLFKFKQHSAGTQPGVVAAEPHGSLGVCQPSSQAHAVGAQQKAPSPEEESSTLLALTDTENVIPCIWSSGVILEEEEGWWSWSKAFWSVAHG